MKTTKNCLAEKLSEPQIQIDPKKFVGNTFVFRYRIFNQQQNVFGQVGDGFFDKDGHPFLRPREIEKIEGDAIVGLINIGGQWFAKIKNKYCESYREGELMTMGNGGKP